MHMHTHIHILTHIHRHINIHSTHTLHYYSTTGHGGSVTSVKWSEDNQWLLTCSTEKMARVWTADRKDPVLVINTVKHNFTSSQERDTVCLIPTILPLSFSQSFYRTMCRSTRRLPMHSSFTWISSSCWHQQTVYICTSTTSISAKWMKSKGSSQYSGTHWPSLQTIQYNN